MRMAPCAPRHGCAGLPINKQLWGALLPGIATFIVLGWLSAAYYQAQVLSQPQPQPQPQPLSYVHPSCPKESSGGNGPN